MAVPVVAIVGRPNVGKSSLFNWLAGRRIAIVDSLAGVTRDRLSTLVQSEARIFELVDTGGIGIQDIDNLTEQVERQIEIALQQAQVLLFVVDIRTGLQPLDEKVAEKLRRLPRPTILVANKCDTPNLEPLAAEFYKLGLGPVVAVSAQHNRGRAALLEKILPHLPAEGNAEAKPDEAVVKFAIVGRRNTGKSTFINCVAQGERVIVSEIPGTTRDSVDVRFERDGRAFIAIDTAGVRRKSSVGNDIEFYGIARAERSIRRADVVLLFLDAQKRVSKLDKQLAEYILAYHKPAVFVVNKWDLVRPLPTERFGDYLRSTFPSLDFVPIAFITAKSGKNVPVVLNLAQHLHKQAGARVSTGELNRALRLAMEQQPPPLRQNRRPKIFYATQVAAHPPTLVLFTNGPDLFDNTYLRYLLKTFRNHLPFNDVPIRLLLRSKVRADQPAIEKQDQAGVPGEPRSGNKGRTRRPKRRDRPSETSAQSRRESKGTKKGNEPELWKEI